MSMKKYWKFDVRSDSDIVRALRYAAKFGAVTNNGFPYDSSLVSMKGSQYSLFVPYVTGKTIEESQKDIDDAVFYIRNFIGDVVGKINVVMVESEMYLHQFSERKSYPIFSY